MNTHRPPLPRTSVPPRGSQAYIAGSRIDDDEAACIAELDSWGYTVIDPDTEDLKDRLRCVLSADFVVLTRSWMFNYVAESEVMVARILRLPILNCDLSEVFFP